MKIAIKKVPHKEVVKQRFLQNQRKITMSFVFVLLCILVILFVYVYQSMELVALVNEEAIEKRKLAVQEKLLEGYLQQQVSLSSLQRVEFIAKEQLGMVEPDQESVVYIEK
ncbi:MAG: cell division protein FtsL [Candidatus Cloacimonetes bacterium]|nr:cell division protein FtsL [Candidatus Cloacimonadota bacterium]